MNDDDHVDAGLIGETFRSESGRAIASLVRRFGDIDLAEEAVQDAFAQALTWWPVDGLPPSPGWVDHHHRSEPDHRPVAQGVDPEERHHRAVELTAQLAPDPDIEDHAVDDDQLRLIFTCCHPALAPDAQVALTLRLIGGLTTDEIARAFLVEQRTMAQRLTRAKRKIKHNNIPYRIPTPAELPGRLRSALAVVYLIFNEGYLPASGDHLTRPELSAEAIRLARLLGDLLPDEPEVIGLLALLVLTEARRPARTDSTSGIVRLADQDRSLWERALITEGHELVRRCVRRDQPGPYQLQAAIAAIHASAPMAGDTSWDKIVDLYDRLLALVPTPIVALNRAIAVAELHGPEAALALVDPLRLDQYPLKHATRGDLLERLGQHHAAAESFTRAADLTDNLAERAFLRGRADACRRPRSGQPEDRLSR